MMFRNCPARLDQEAAVRCGLPAKVRCRFTPNGATTYFLGHSAGLWRSAMRPRHRRATGTRAAVGLTSRCPYGGYHVPGGAGSSLPPRPGAVLR